MFHARQCAPGRLRLLCAALLAAGVGVPAGDALALLGDRLIFLCWHLGETEVTHWHSIEGGFSERQPLDRSELD